MRSFKLVLLLPLLITGCMSIPYIMEPDEAKATEQIQENRTEAQMAQIEYEELKSQRSEE